MYLFSIENRTEQFRNFHAIDNGRIHKGIPAHELTGVVGYKRPNYF